MNRSTHTITRGLLGLIVALLMTACSNGGTSTTDNGSNVVDNGHNITDNGSDVVDDGKDIQSGADIDSVSDVMVPDIGMDNGANDSYGSSDVPVSDQTSIDLKCTPGCTGKECGDDGCGGNCGICGSGKTCVEGKCKSGVEVVWDRSFGGSKTDAAFSIQQTKDGGYIVAGITKSKGAGSGDVWVLKLDPDGVPVWDKTFGGSKADAAFSIQQTKDGGYIVAGYTASKGAGANDAWVLRLASDGTLLWDKTFGGSNFDVVYSIQQTKDGGYIMVGNTVSNGGGNFNAWVMRLASDGTPVWNKTFGGSGPNEVKSVWQTTDGGYIVAGWTYSKKTYSWDAWVLRLTSDGTLLWDKTFGGSNAEVAFSIRQTMDGGYIVAGNTESKGAGKRDAWVLRLDPDGTTIWDNTFGGNDDDEAYSIQQTTDGGYIVAGYTDSKGAGNKDAWVLRLASDGTLVRDKTFGGNGEDEAKFIRQTMDGGYIVAGYTESKGAGGEDAWVLKLK